MTKHKLKRELSSAKDFVSLPSSIGPRKTVGFVTFPIYLEELGSYCAVVWDMDGDEPKIMLLNHGIFPAIRRWIFDFRNLIGTSFTVIATLKGTVVSHNVFPGGGYLLTESKMQMAKDYVENTFEVYEEEEEMKEDGI